MDNVSNTDTLTRNDAEVRGSFTRTSVTIPDELLIEAKAVSVTTKISVSDILIAGLRRELDARKTQESGSGDTAGSGARRQR